MLDVKLLYGVRGELLPSQRNSALRTWAETPPVPGTFRESTTRSEELSHFTLHHCHLVVVVQETKWALSYSQ